MVNHLYNVRQQSSNSQKELEAAVNLLNAQKAQLEALQLEQKSIGVIDQDMKNASLIIETTLQQTSGIFACFSFSCMCSYLMTIVLKAIAQKLVDFREVISVLRGVYLSLIQKGFIVGVSPSDYISLSDVESVGNSLTSLESKLNNFPFNDAENIEC